MSDDIELLKERLDKLETDLKKPIYPGLAYGIRIDALEKRVKALEEKQ